MFHSVADTITKGDNNEGRVDVHFVQQKVVDTWYKPGLTRWVRVCRVPASSNMDNVLCWRLSYFLKWCIRVYEQRDLSYLESAESQMMRAKSSVPKRTARTRT